MTDMQRFNVNWNGSLRQYEQVLDPRGPYVWASDAEAAIAAVIDDQVKEIAEYVTAIAAAEQRGRDEAVMDDMAKNYQDGKRKGYEQGQRDMLARCIAAVSRLVPKPGATGEHYLAALDALKHGSSINGTSVLNYDPAAKDNRP